MDPTPPTEAEVTPPPPGGVELESPAEAVAAVTDKVWGWGEMLVLMLPNILIALVVLVLAWFAARLAAAGVQRAFAHVLKHSQLRDLAALVVRTAVMIGGLFLALSVLELDKTVTSLLAGVGVVGIALGFAFQDIAANFMSGVLIVSRRPFDVGDQVELSGIEGVVRAIDLRSVTLQRYTGEWMQIPNKDVFQNPMVNHNRGGMRRIDLAVGVGYSTDLEQALSIGREVIERHHRMPDRSVDALVMGLGESSIDLSLRFWIPAPDDKGVLKSRSEALIDLKRAFDDAGIDIPFPTRTLLGGAPIRLAHTQDPEVESAAAK